MEKTQVKLTYSLTQRAINLAYKGDGRKSMTNQQKFNPLLMSPEVWLPLVDNKEPEPHKSKVER